MKSVIGEDFLNTYSMPAPWGSIVLTEAFGELWQVSVSDEASFESTLVPETISHWMETIDRELKTGETISDKDFELLKASRRFGELSPLAQITLQTLRRIPRGQWMSYQKLAETIKSPSYARAVARCLSANPFPILLPCHRVVGKDELRHFNPKKPITLIPKSYLGRSEWSKIGGWLRLNDLINAT